MANEYITYKNTDNFSLTDVYLIQAKEEGNYYDIVRESVFINFNDDGTISLDGIGILIDENTPFFVENRTYYAELIDNIVVDGNEIKIPFNDEIDYDFSIMNKPLYVGIGDNNRYFVIGKDELESSFVLKLDRNIEETNNPIISIYAVDYVSDFLEYEIITSNTINENGSDQDIIVLTGRNTDNLTNFDVHTKQKSQITKYEDLDTKFSDLSSEDFEQIESLHLKLDFSKFENHVKFGSARAKVVNAIKKFDDLRTKKADSNVPVSILKDIGYTFSPFEKWIFENKYVKQSEVNFDTYMDNLQVLGDDYDAQNPEMIWYSVPSSILEEDTTGYFSNFLLLIGEVFDYFYTYINAMGKLKEDPHDEETLGDKFIFNELKDLGFGEEYAYDISTFENFYEDENAVKNVSFEIARRLLHNLPLLNSSKGTLKIIDYIFNIYGIPKNLFEIIEFTNNKTTDNSSEIKYKENRYYLSVPNSTSSVDIDFTNSDMSVNDYTIELAVNNWTNVSGDIVEFGDNYISFEKSGSYYAVGVGTNGVLSKQTEFIVPENDLWTYVAVNKTGSSGHIYLSQQDDMGFGLVNTKEYDFEYSESVSTFDSMSLFPDDLASISEFKIYDRAITEKEFRDHAKDFRGVAEIKGESNLNLRKSFSIPESTTGSTEVGNYDVTYNNIEDNDYLIDEFFSFTDVKLFDQEYGGNKILFVDTSYEGSHANLSRLQHNVEYGNTNKNNDPNRLGIFIAPNEKVNKQIFRNIIDDADLIPVPYKDTNSYEYLDLNDELLTIKDVDPKYSDLYHYYYLQSLLSDKLYRLISHFMPANTDLEMGLLIQNSVLRKNKYPNGSKSITTRIGLNKVVGSDVIETPNKVTKTTTIDDKPSNTSISPVDITSRVDFIEKNTNSVYLNTVETKVITTSPFATNVFKSSALNAVSDAFENLEDAGASIQIN